CVKCELNIFTYKSSMFIIILSQMSNVIKHVKNCICTLYDIDYSLIPSVIIGDVRVFGVLPGGFALKNKIDNACCLDIKHIVHYVFGFNFFLNWTTLIKVASVSYL
ncbi:hypothetical protein ACJX0J_024475, partial [Zea mays]